MLYEWNGIVCMYSLGSAPFNVVLVKFTHALECSYVSDYLKRRMSWVRVLPASLQPKDRRAQGVYQWTRPGDCEGRDSGTPKAPESTRLHPWLLKQ